MSINNNNIVLTKILQPPSDFIFIFLNNTKVYNGKNSNSNHG